MRSSLKSKQPLIIPLCGKNLNLTIRENDAKFYPHARGYTDWLSRIVKDEKAKRNTKIFELWPACHTQEAIAEAVGVDQKTITNISDDFRKTVLENQTPKINANHTADFDIPIYKPA